jgi:hypothetical protein
MMTSSREDDRDEKDSAAAVRRIEITGTLDRHAVEVLQLEIRRLAKRCGVEIKTLRVERLGKGSSAKSL